MVAVLPDSSFQPNFPELSAPWLKIEEAKLGFSN